MLQAEKKKIRRSNNSAISQPKLHNSKTEKERERQDSRQTQRVGKEGGKEGGRGREKGTGEDWNRQSNSTQISLSCARVRQAALYVTDIPESVHNKHEGVCVGGGGVRGGD